LAVPRVDDTNFVFEGEVGDFMRPTTSYVWGDRLIYPISTIIVKTKLFQRIRSRWLRFWSKFIFTIVPRRDLKRIGSDYGGWVIPADLVSESSVCYCAGVGEDITFDLALIEIFGCEVFAFDPTPRAIEHVKHSAQGIGKFHFYDVGLWSDDITLKFFAPDNPHYVSHSIDNLDGTSTFFDAPCKKVSTLMKELKHTTVDLMKIDIEGAEYEVLENMVQEKVFPTILCVEFDPRVTFLKTKIGVHGLVSVGYQLVNIDGWNYTFVHR
jgi:FkbM family methyltransferase